MGVFIKCKCVFFGSIYKVRICVMWEYVFMKWKYVFIIKWEYVFIKWECTAEIIA